MTFFSDALGHSAFTGIAIGALCGLRRRPRGCAVVFAGGIRPAVHPGAAQRTDMASDTVIGVFSSTAVALGIFIATLGGGVLHQIQRPA